MKSLPIRMKITLWFTAALVVVSLFSYFVVLSVGRQILQKTIKDNLIETVEHNVDEIEYFPAGPDDGREDVDHYIQYGQGYLEIDDDFLDQVNQVYTALYYMDGSLIYGENPVSRESAARAFSNSQLQSVNVSGTQYYIFDRQLSGSGLEGLWLRGIVSETQGAQQSFAIARFSLILLPLVVLLAAVGGYLLARRMLLPIQQLSQTAAAISGGGDLKARIELGSGTDELQQLAASFNGMISRLDKAFESERRFADDVSHELRTPVSVISAQCELSLEKEQSVQDYQKALRLIQRQSRKMSRLISQMLEFSRLEMGTESYPLEELDLSQLCLAVCSDMELIGEKGISLSREIEVGLYFVGNRQLLTRLLTNLIGNAYRYGREQGHILVRLESGEDELLLSVSDDGIGISQAELENIFQRFYRVDSSRSSEGSGLGLAMAREIAVFHKAELRVDSQEGKGSCFSLHLPKN